jgi:hypothetical protein
VFAQEGNVEVAEKLQVNARKWAEKFALFAAEKDDIEIH